MAVSQTPVFSLARVKLVFPLQLLWLDMPDRTRVLKCCVRGSDQTKLSPAILQITKLRGSGPISGTRYWDNRNVWTDGGWWLRLGYYLSTMRFDCFFYTSSSLITKWAGPSATPHGFFSIILVWWNQMGGTSTEHMENGWCCQQRPGWPVFCPYRSEIWCSRNVSRTTSDMLPRFYLKASQAESLSWPLSSTSVL